jgi:hypothetical protein
VNWSATSARSTTRILAKRRKLSLMLSTEMCKNVLLGVGDEKLTKISRVYMLCLFVVRLFLDYVAIVSVPIVKFDHALTNYS